MHTIHLNLSLEEAYAVAEALEDHVSARLKALSGVSFLLHQREDHELPSLAAQACAFYKIGDAIRANEDEEVEAAGKACEAAGKACEARKEAAK